ncbi:MAG: 5,6-dimethylbenzimidazole synthase [Pseudomonadota bacterium]
MARTSAVVVDATANPEQDGVLAPFDDAFRSELDRLFAVRRDVRTFRADTVPDDHIAACLATFETAPSVGLSQPWRLVEVKNPEARAAVQANFREANAIAANQYVGAQHDTYTSLKLAGLETAPVQLAVFCEPDPSQGHGLGRQTQPAMVHASAVCGIMQVWLAARARGIGLGWVSILDVPQLKRDLDIQLSWDLVAYLCLGYPAEPSEVPELERAGWEHRDRERTVRLIR